MNKSITTKIIIYVLIPLVLFAQGENWIYQYNGSANSYDWANSIAYGDDGNIYVAGRSYGIGTYLDFMVISLTNAGDTNWVYRYEGPINSHEWANSIVYGSDDNIYAAGCSADPGPDWDLMVLSLTTAGDTNWVYRYERPGNASDEARDIVYGLDNNIYVAGYSTDSGTYADFTVLSLTTAGDTNWVYRYNGPGSASDEARAIVYGADSNIYVAGESSGVGEDFTVISLTTAGDTNWVYRYNGPGDNNDGAFSITYGSDGHIYAAGYSRDSSTSADFMVISLTTAGDTNWVYRYDGPGNSDDCAYSIFYGSDDNIYVAGSSRGNSINADFIVISLTTHGDTNWVYRYDGPGSSDDCANSIVYSSDGNIYVAGHSSGIGTFADFTVISLTTAGDTNWVYRYNGPGDNNDGAFSITYGSDGNIYAAGYSSGNDTYADFTVISLPPDLGVHEKKIYVRKNNLGTTIFSGPLLLPEDKMCKVFDITGRVVMPNKIKPGIYFIEVDEKIIKKVVKVR